MAVTSMILGLMGIFCCFGVSSIIGVPLGLAAIASVGRSGGRLTGGGMAWVGVIVGILSLVLWVGLGVAYGPAGARFGTGMVVTAGASGEFLLAMSDDDADAAWELTGDEYRAKHPRAEFDGRWNALKKERGLVSSWGEPEVDEETFKLGNEDEGFKITYLIPVTWSEGGEARLALTWAWEWTKDFQQEPKPYLVSFEVR